MFPETLLLTTRAGVPGSSCGDRCSRVWERAAWYSWNCLLGLPEALPEALLFFSCSHSCIPLIRQSACDWIALKPSCRLWRPRVNPWKRSWTWSPTSSTAPSRCPWWLAHPSAPPRPATKCDGESPLPGCALGTQGGTVVRPGRDMAFSGQLGRPHSLFVA